MMQMMQKLQQRQLNQCDFIAYHVSKPYNGRANPAPSIVKIVQFWKKDFVWALKIMLKIYWNNVDGERVFFRERLAERDCDLMDYMDGLGLVTTTNKCVPEVMVKNSQWL